MATKHVDLRTTPLPGVSVGLFACVCKFLTEKYGDRHVDIATLRLKLQDVENYYVTQAVWEGK